MIRRKPQPKATATAVVVTAEPAVATAAPIPALALPKSSRVAAVPPCMAALAATPDNDGPPRRTFSNPITAYISKRPLLVKAVMPRVVVPSSSSLMSTTSTPTNTAAMAAGLKTTGLEEVFADDGAKVGDDVTAASSLLSLDTLVETAVKSINKGVIPTSLSK